jgi:hypothetical protein
MWSQQRNHGKTRTHPYMHPRISLVTSCSVDAAQDKRGTKRDRSDFQVLDPRVLVITDVLVRRATYMERLPPPSSCEIKSNGYVETRRGPYLCLLPVRRENRSTEVQQNRP